MLTRKFVIETHPEYGMAGLVPQWMPDHQHDPLVGMGVAHDVLEHGPNDVCEWQGLGGSLWVRPPDYYSNRRIGNPNRSENIAAEFHNLFQLWEGRDIPNPGRTQRVDIEVDIDEILESGRRLVRSEARYSGDADDLNKSIAWTRDEQLDRMRGWLRKGYRAAIRRWATASQWDLLATFIEIESRADKLLKTHEDYVGSDVVLRFDPARADVRFSVITTF